MLIQIDRVEKQPAQTCECPICKRLGLYERAVRGLAMEVR